MNPLLDFSDLPRFDAIQPEHVAPAIQSLLEENRALIARLASQNTPATWDDFVAPLMDAAERLARAWGVVSHMHSVNDVVAWRAAYNALLPEVTRYYTELGQNLGLYRHYKALAESPAFSAFSSARRRVIEQALRDFRLSGAELSEAEKPRFMAIQEELSQLAAKFSENLLDATNAYTEWVVDEARLAGLPEDVKQAAAEAAEREGKTGWKFTLHAPSYLPVMQYADDRALRERMYRAYATRASEFGPATRDNGPLIERILTLREEEAKLLGFANYAELSLEPKMAATPAEVADFLRELARRARPFAERELAELTAFAREELGLATLESWDLTWASEKLKQSRHGFSDDEVKQYFPEPKVLEGLFRCIGALFKVEIEPDRAPAWHPDVRFFRILREGRLVGRFYLDLYARESKRGGAWMADAICRRRKGETVQTPVAYLCCNFSPPVGGRPALFTHDDVQTLFHETGHALHHLLTEVDEYGVSGIDGVEWDAVELPSQFMENFCWDWDVLQAMSAHVETGEPLPRALFDKMWAARNFQSGLLMLRQIEFALFDLRLHWENRRDFLTVLEEVREEVAVFRPPAWNRFPQSFSHIFAGGYAAGYYSYKWAEVLSADAYAAFEERQTLTGSVLDATLGERFWREILAVGGSRPALESFLAFRGRRPSLEALLRHAGLVEDAGGGMNRRHDASVVTP
ncbi:MAG: M3 family metallopeptidase [Rhodocyclaceae bacterium]|nr:M3 family metallopeptidase [Rhodocyclaceae bacterium]